MTTLPYKPGQRLSPDGFRGKILLLVVDKLFLGAVILLALTPLQHRFEAMQKRHDRAVEIGDTVINKALDHVSTLTAEVMSYVAAVDAGKHGSKVKIDQLVQSRARIDTDISIMTAFVNTPEVVAAGKELSKAVADLNDEIMMAPATPIANDKIAAITQKHTSLVFAVVQGCREMLNTNTGKEQEASCVIP